MSNEDAEFADLIAAAIARLDPSLEQRLESEPEAHLDLVQLTQRAYDETTTLLNAAVSSARTAGLSWEAIGSRLGMTRQAAQQRFGQKPVSIYGTAEYRRLQGLTAFNEMDRLNAWGRHGWHSIGYGPLFHDIEKSNVQWEHQRVGIGSAAARELESNGWERIGLMWFPWIYLKRSIDLPAVPGEPG